MLKKKKPTTAPAKPKTNKKPAKAGTPDVDLSSIQDMVASIDDTINAVDEIKLKKEEETRQRKLREAVSRCGCW